MNHRFQWLANALAGALPGRGGRRPGTPPVRPAPDHSFDFDALARDLAAGLSRREALRRLGLGLGGAFLAALGLGSPGWAVPCPPNQVRCSGACVNLLTNPFACGTCTNQCAAGARCVSGHCFCPIGLYPCQGVCVNLQSDAKNCGSCQHICGPPYVCSGGHCLCPDGQQQCGHACVDLRSDATNCGSCGHNCAANAICTLGKCVAICPAGQSVCNGKCVTVATDSANCGACGHLCPAGTSCVTGVCLCAGGLAACRGAQGTSCCAAGESCCDGACCASGQYCCGGQCRVCPCDKKLCTGSKGTNCCAAGETCCDGACVNAQTDVDNCGGCGKSCAGGQHCGAGLCRSGCPADRPTLCGATCVNVQTDAANCGGCGQSCPANQICSSAVCVTCATGLVRCGNSCVDTRSDPTNCGVCGNTCFAGQICSFPAGCVCPPGFDLDNGICCRTGLSNCGGTCVDTRTDTTNCGVCGNTCFAGQVCSFPAGCVCPMGFDADNGICCRTGLSNCGGACVDLRGDVNNCGVCGHTCATGQICSFPAGCRACAPGYPCPADQFCDSGLCRHCSAGLTACLDGCVNMLTDPNHCGDCFNVCAFGNCVKGICG